LDASEDGKMTLLSAPRDVSIALLGYGTVGSAVDRHLRENADSIQRATGLHLQVTHALVRDPHKKRHWQPGTGVLTTEFSDIRDDHNVDAVAEVMGGLEPAHGFIRELLGDGKKVATANKQLLAGVGHNLLGRVHASGSVGGAVPFTGVLRVGIPPGGCTRVTGVVNSTTNFILHRVEAGASFREALSEAQTLHIAEADATDDLSGADAGAKMAILASLAFCLPFTLADVSYEGIQDLDEEWVRAVRARGGALRLVGTATRDSVEVRLTELAATHPLALLEETDNALIFEGPGFRSVTLSGPGAGGPATAAAVVADLVELVR
jgi:homoserine dehydrogenase